MGKNKTLEYHIPKVMIRQYDNQYIDNNDEFLTKFSRHDYDNGEATISGIVGNNEYMIHKNPSGYMGYINLENGNKYEFEGSDRVSQDFINRVDSLNNVARQRILRHNQESADDNRQREFDIKSWMESQKTKAYQPGGEIRPDVYILDNTTPTRFFTPIIPPVIERKPTIYDRIEDPDKSKTHYAFVDKMQFGGQDNTETGFLDNLTMPIATGNRAERIMNRIDRRANRAVGRIENGRMNVRRWDRFGNQHARDLGRLNEINSVRWDLHLPESRRDARETVLNYLNSIGMNEVENLPKYPWHY